MAATGIGSVPFTDPGETVSLDFKDQPQVPYWPLMVRLGFEGRMTSQSARGMAALKIDEAARTVEVTRRGLGMRPWPNFMRRPCPVI